VVEFPSDVEKTKEVKLVMCTADVETIKRVLE